MPNSVNLILLRTFGHFMQWGASSEKCEVDSSALYPLSVIGTLKTNADSGREDCGISLEQKYVTFHLLR
jgi:hypothetical protein